MEIKIFRSNKGDCLLISSDFPTQKNRHILVDGGLVGSFRNHVIGELHKILDAEEKLDVVCVSHIDDDHIAGILELLDQTIDWRVHKHFLGDNDRNEPEPDFPEPPEIGEIWHNAFSEFLGRNTGQIVDALAHSAQVLSGSQLEEMLEAAEYATSVKQAIELSRKVNARQLGIPLNPRHDNKLILYRPNQGTVRIGRFRITIIGPTEESMEELRDEWNTWLRRNRDVLRRIRRSAAIDEDRLQTDSFAPLLPLLTQDDADLGDRNQVTTPNLASIMFLLEEGQTKVLMTGDGHGDDILEGLKLTNKLNNNDALHVDVLKIQHHGSEFNLDAAFCRKITADHYIFCGNGAHHNPNLDVLKAVLNSRMGNADQLSQNNEVNNNFKFWFSSNSRITSASRRPHMRDIESLMVEKKADSGGQFDFEFMGDNADFLSLSL